MLGSEVVGCEGFMGLRVTVRVLEEALVVLDFGSGRRGCGGCGRRGSVYCKRVRWCRNNRN